MPERLLPTGISGFLLASRMPPLVSAAVVRGLESLSNLSVRDGPVLDRILFVHPFQAMLDWQFPGR
jgi:hypothetical protein